MTNVQPYGSPSASLNTGASRRTVLGVVGTGVGVAALAAGRVAAAEPDPAGTRLGAAGPRIVIDTHHHMLPPVFVQAVGRDKIAAVMPNRIAPDWSPALDLEVMDAFGIDKAVLSVSPGLWTSAPAEAVVLARQVNDYGAGLIGEHPKRYGQFAVMPLPDIDASLIEAAYALDELKADGLIVFSNYDGHYLGDPLFAPVWQELNRRKAVVFVHPTKSGFSQPDVPDAILEFVFDTTRTIVSMVYGGVTIRYPDIRFIFSHAGGAAPYLAGRIEGPARGNPRLAHLLPNGAVAELRKFYWDTALSFTEPSMKCLLSLTDPSKIMFGSDFPFVPRQEGMQTALGSLSRVLAPADLAKVLHGSAASLMPRLA